MKKGTKEMFKGMTIELSTFNKIHKNKWNGEPIYRTVSRMACIYDESELKDAQFMLHEYEETMKRQKQEIDQLKAERRNALKLEESINKLEQYWHE